VAFFIGNQGDLFHFYRTIGMEKAQDLSKKDCFLRINKGDGHIFNY